MLQELEEETMEKLGQICILRRGNFQSFSIGFEFSQKLQRLSLVTRLKSPILCFIQAFFFFFN